MKRKLKFALIPLLLLSVGSAALAFRGVGARATLGPTPLAANVGLENASGDAYVLDYLGGVYIRVDLGGAQLPEGTVLEGWVVDAGLLGGPGTTSASPDDEAHGTPFGNPDFAAMVENAPYALSTGVLERRGNKQVVSFRIKNNLTPYDAVVVTAESDGNGDDYDPRPGTPVLLGLIER